MQKLLLMAPTLRALQPWRKKKTSSISPLMMMMRTSQRKFIKQPALQLRALPMSSQTVLFLLMIKLIIVQIP